MSKDDGDRPTDGEAQIERRRQPRTGPASGEWESVVLRRMARRVESLNATQEMPGGGSDEEEFGWEAASLRNLGRHLKDRDGS
jgi:hypothetical protein